MYVEPFPIKTGPNNAQLYLSYIGKLQYKKKGGALEKGADAQAA